MFKLKETYITECTYADTTEMPLLAMCNHNLTIQRQTIRVVCIILGYLILKWGDNIMHVFFMFGDRKSS